MEKFMYYIYYIFLCHYYNRLFILCISKQINSASFIIKKIYCPRGIKLNTLRNSRFFRFIQEITSSHTHRACKTRRSGIQKMELQRTSPVR